MATPLFIGMVRRPNKFLNFDAQPLNFPLTRRRMANDTAFPPEQQ